MFQRTWGWSPVDYALLWSCITVIGQFLATGIISDKCIKWKEVPLIIANLELYILPTGVMVF